MPVSPQDFELYSRMTGTPMPSDAMSRMQMAPAVYDFTKNFARKPNLLEKTGNLIKTVGKIGAYGLGLGMQQSLANEQRAMEEKLRTQAEARQAEALVTGDSGVEAAPAPELTAIEKGELAKQKTIKLKTDEQIRLEQARAKLRNIAVEKLDTPIDDQNEQEPTTADAFGQDRIENQTADNVVDKKMEQGSQIADSTPNIAQVLSESQDSQPASMFRPTQIPTTGALHAATPIVGEGLSKSGNEINVIKGAEEEVVGSGATSDKVQDFLKKMGGTDEGSKLDIALIAAMQDRDKKERFYLGANSGDPALGDSPLLDHPDIIGGEDDSSLPSGTNTSSTQDLSSFHKEMRRMDTMERNKEVIDEIVEKTPSPSERQVGSSPNELAGKDQSAFEAIQAGIPVEEQKAARQRVLKKTAEKRKQKGVMSPSVNEKSDDFMAKFVEGARSDIVRGQRGNQSLGITRIPATNGDSQVGFVLANRPIDQSPSTATTYGFGVAPGAEDIIKGSLDANTFDTYMDRGMKEARQGKKRKAGEIFEFLAPKARIVQGKANLGDIVM